MKNLEEATKQAVNYFYENNNDDFLQGSEDDEFVSKKEIEGVITHNAIDDEIEFSFYIGDVEGMMTCGTETETYIVNL